MRPVLVAWVMVFLVTACSPVREEGPPVFDTVEEILDRELGEAKVLATKEWNGNTFYLYLRDRGTSLENISVGAFRKVDGGYAWISSPGFRIDIAARFDFDLRDGSEPVDIYIGKVGGEHVRRVSVRGVAETFDVYDGYFWGFGLPEHVEVEIGQAV